MRLEVAGPGVERLFGVGRLLKVGRLRFKGFGFRVRGWGFTLGLVSRVSLRILVPGKVLGLVSSQHVV